MEISDPRAIRALAHPLRLDLLKLLGATGPATAAQCGRVLGVPQANCSFHLRQLAKYGFVEDAGPGEDRRERQWRVPESGPTVRIADGGDEKLHRQLERTVVERELQAILDYAELRAQESPAWRGKAGIVSAIALVSPDDVAEIEEKWQELLAPYTARTAAAGARPDGGQQRHVRYFMSATPLREHGAHDETHASYGETYEGSKGDHDGTDG